MAKLPSSVVGVDLGFHTMKAVHLQRKSGGKLFMAGYATREVENGFESTEELARHIKLLVQEVGANTKSLSAAVSGKDLLIRIVEQPFLPVEMLRNALKLNAKSLLHEDCDHLVLDCDFAQQRTGKQQEEASVALQKTNYVVAGLKRDHVEKVSGAFKSSRIPLSCVQLAPLSLLNAFEQIEKEVFSEKPFILLDIGHDRSMMVGGIQGELVMVRTVNFGGKDFVKALTMDGAIDTSSAILLAEQGDAGMTDLAFDSLKVLSREVLSSVGFFEGQWDQTVDRIFVSGGASRAEMLLQVLSDEVNLPCQVWDLLDRCDVGPNCQKKKDLQKDARNLNVAFGAAVEMLTKSA